MKNWFNKKFDSFNNTFGLQMLAIEKINSLAGEKIVEDEFYFYSKKSTEVYLSHEG